MDTMLEYYDQGVIASWDKEFFLENAPNLAAWIEKGGLHGMQADSVDLFWEYSMKDGQNDNRGRPSPRAGICRIRCSIPRGLAGKPRSGGFGPSDNGR